MKAAARLVLLAGAAVGALFFFRASPRDVTLVYDLGDAAVREVDVDVERAGETVRHAELRFARGAPAQVRHEVRLTDGDYVVHLRVVRDAAASRIDRAITVSESQTIVLNARP